jgi:hypothetical protein
MSTFKTIARRWSFILRSHSQFRVAGPRNSRRRECPRLESLEDRTVLSSFNLPVTSLADSGPGTLRAAIAQADAGSTAQTYKITFKVSGTIKLESALPDLSKSMNLSGPGASRLTVGRDGNASAYFGIFVVDTGVAVKISGMTIANGFTTYPNLGTGIDNAGALSVSRTTISGNEGGGGIHNSGALTVSHSFITQNSGVNGGGISNTGTVTVSFTTIFHNSGYSNGGGIDNAGMLTVQHSTIYSNHVGSGIIGPGMAFPEGGGIYNEKNGTVFLSRTTVSRNAAYRGAGIFNNGDFTANRATIFGNTSDDSGGGISSSATLILNQTTISGNTAVTGGGGINNFGPLTVKRSTISRNSAGDGSTGGGINNSGSLNVSHSTISRNSGGVGSTGGGINNSGSLILSDSKISANSLGTGSTGGGINNSGPLTVSFTTISSNSATTGGGVYNSGGAQAEVDFSTINDTAGGGIVNNDAAGTNKGSAVRLKKTVVDGVFYKQFQYGP